MSESKSFLIYKHLSPVVDQLSDKDAGTLLKAVFKYETTLEESNLSREAQMAFTVFKIYLDNAREKYDQTCERNRQNARGKKAKGSHSLPLAPNGSHSHPMDANNNNNNNNNNKKILSTKKGSYKPKTKTLTQWKGIAE